MSEGPVTYVCRLCWNTQGWSALSNSCGALETKSYVSEYGFGHEEWLFDWSKLIDGYHYGELLPVHKSLKRLGGEVINLLLYTLAPDKKRYYVGLMCPCEVLSRSESDAALSTYREMGWLRQMEDQLAIVGWEALRKFQEECRSEQLFSVRFRPEDVELFEPLRPADPTDQVCQAPNRYQLVRADENVQGQWSRRGRRGSTAPRGESPSVRTASAEDVQVDRLHNRLQNRLFVLLIDRYGPGVAVMERDFVDISVTVVGQPYLIEVKSHADPRVAIREAVGQLLEYAYYGKGESGPLPKCVVAAPGAATAESNQYLNVLKRKHGLMFSYLQISETMNEAPDMETLSC